MPWKTTNSGLRIFYNELGEIVGYQLSFAKVSPAETESLTEEVRSGRPLPGEPAPSERLL